MPQCGHEDIARIQLSLSHVGYEGLANLTYDYFPNARHWLFWDDPRGFQTSLEKFLHRVEPQQPASSTPVPSGEGEHRGKKGKSLASSGASSAH